MPQTVDRLDFAHPDVDPAQWPKLSCGAASQLAIQTGSLRLESDRESSSRTTVRSARWTTRTA